MGCDLAASGNFAAAITKWNEGLIYDNNNHILYELLAQGYIQLERWFDAVQSANRSVAIDPHWSESRLTLARAQRELGEVELSLQSYKIAVELDPCNQEAISELAEIEV